MRYRDMRELMGNISPDVRQESAEEFTDRRFDQARLKVQEAALAEAGQASKSKVLEEKFLSNWKALGGPDLEREYAFHATRKWRFDFAHRAKRVAFEIQGGLYAAESGHRSFEGVTRDYEKLNAAQMDGWIVLQLTSKSLQDAAYLTMLIEFVNNTEMLDKNGTLE